MSQTSDQLEPEFLCRACDAGVCLAEVEAEADLHCAVCGALLGKHADFSVLQTGGRQLDLWIARAWRLLSGVRPTPPPP